MSEKGLIINDSSHLDMINESLREITKKHKKVSDMVTPKPHIKKKMGLDYVEYSYMREIADQEYPGWSWTIIKTEMAGSEAYIIHGRLKWFDNGVWREGDMTAAHRIQKKRGTAEFVDIGNDVKAANTDCIKKAFNMYMNIADDVYRNQVEDFSLSDKQREEILTAAGSISDEKMKQIKSLVDDMSINTSNYDISMSKLEYEANNQ
tara:strand:+ start:1469 stop:2086 length:618 start_codon:yes stop_codon:yes gene_type:complete